MKNPIIQTAACILAAVLLFACAKTETTSTPPPPPVSPPKPPTDTTAAVVGTMNVNLNYPDQTTTGSFELIISEPGGKVLIDTLAQAKTPVKAALKTNATLVDVTYILDNGSSSPGIPRYNVNVYKGVNPSGWVNLTSILLPLGYPFAGSTPPSVLDCRNFPAAAITDGNILHAFQFSNGVNNTSTGVSYNSGINEFMLSYNRHSGIYNYLVLPNLGLCKFYISNGNMDTLDLSQMDTVKTITFARPFPFTVDYQRCTFQGIVDTTDLSKSVSFINIFAPIAPGTGDLQCPKMPMQKYETSIAARNSLNDDLYYYGYATTVPTNLNFPDASSITVISHQADNFSVKFSSPATTTSCMTRLGGTDVFANICSSADSASFHPVSFLKNLKSKLLNGAALNDLVPKSFEFKIVPGFGYADYLSYTTDPALAQTHQISTYTMFTRGF